LTPPTLLDIFSHIKDHRRAEGKLYPLPQILVFCLLAMLAGASSYRKMPEFIVAHFRRLSVLFPSKMLKAPCYAQIRNIMAGLDPADMEQAFRLHAQGLSSSGADGLTLLAIDGKSLRGSFDALKDKKPTQILSVFATGGRIILAHVDIADKTNEIPVAQALIAELKLEGCLVTFDALHCQKKTFQAAAAVGSRVLVQVKDNQPSLVAALDTLPATIAPEATSASSENSRNRQEYRHVQVFHADGALDLPEWDEYALKAIRVYRKTWLKDTKTGGWDRREDISWYITNETARTAEFYAAAIRGHWGIENRDHRVRDGALAEDASRIRVNPSICARVRSIALNIFRFNQVENIANEQWRNAMSIDRALAYNGL
jgi:predicted transposase YbfD/YdcC